MIKIYEPKGRAREYSPFALNYFTGCDHGCLYCYVPRIASMSNPSYNHSLVSAKDISDFEKEARRFSKTINRNSQILLSFMGDPYCNFESGQTRDIVDILMNYGLHINILTKNPYKALRDIELFRNYEYIKIGTTLTCMRDIDSLIWESGAPDFNCRVNSLKIFSEAGIKTWVSFEPVLFPGQSLDMIKIVSKLVDNIKIGKLNQFTHPELQRVNWREFLHNATKIADSCEIPFYIKQDLQAYDLGSFGVFQKRSYDSFNI